jgi:hypothetical protein
MDKATLRSTVFGILRRTPQTHFHAIENDVRRELETYERHDVLVLQEVLWELLVQGVLAPGKNSLNLNLPFVHVTEYGAGCLEDGRILAHDPEGYVERLEVNVGAPIDGVVLQSVRGALSVFLSGNLTSTVVLLARAAEILFDLLADSLLQSGDVDTPGRAEVETSPRSSRRRAEAVAYAVRHRTVLDSFRESVEPQLNGLLALIQLSRRLDGAPSWPDPTRDQVLGFLLLFPAQCSVVYRLLDALAL